MMADNNKARQLGVAYFFVVGTILLSVFAGAELFSFADFPMVMFIYGLVGVVGLWLAR